MERYQFCAVCGEELPQRDPHKPGPGPKYCSACRTAVHRRQMREGYCRRIAAETPEERKARMRWQAEYNRVWYQKNRAKRRKGVKT